MAALILTKAIVDNITAAVRADYPDEACGFIAGRETKAERLFPIENVCHSPVAFRMEPVQQIKAMLKMEAEGLDLLAIYHSHPAGPAYPSQTDVAMAYYPEAVQLIVSLEDWPAIQLAAFRIESDNIASVEWRLES